MSIKICSSPTSGVIVSQLHCSHSCFILDLGRARGATCDHRHPPSTIGIRGRQVMNFPVMLIVEPAGVFVLHLDVDGRVCAPAILLYHDWFAFRTRPDRMKFS